jgi:hypothetical protein
MRFSYGDIGSHRMLEIESSNFLTMTLHSASLPDVDASSEIFKCTIVWCMGFSVLKGFVAYIEVFFIGF